MQEQTHTYTDLDTDTETHCEMGFPRAYARSYHSEVITNSSSSSSFLRSTPNVLNLEEHSDTHFSFLRSTPNVLNLEEHSDTVSLLPNCVERQSLIPCILPTLLSSAKPHTVGAKVSLRQNDLGRVPWD